MKDTLNFLDISKKQRVLITQRLRKWLMGMVFVVINFKTLCRLKFCRLYFR